MGFKNSKDDIQDSSKPKETKDFKMNIFKKKDSIVDLKLDKRTQAISHNVVLDDKVTNLGTLVMKIDLDFVVAVMVFVEGCK